MLITFADRLEMIATLANGKVASMVELGVYKGEFAEFCSRKITPEKHVLVDLWDYDRYDFVLAGSPQNAEREEIFENYFGDKPQETLTAAYNRILDTFAGNSSVQIIKADIADAASQFSDEFFEIIYLDGNHTYEFVLRDLYTWFPKLKQGGLFICNDFFESSLASKQNIGVISAFQTFSQRFPVHPIALSMAEWSDLYFSNQPQSPLISRLYDGLANAGHNNLEIPTEILGSFHHRTVERFDRGKFLLPSFQR